MPPSPPPDPDFEQLITYVQEGRGLDFRGYKRTSLRRRITVRMNEVGVDSFSAYQSFLEAHPEEIARLLDTVLINVTSFFRDQEAWELIRNTVVPDLCAAERGNRPIRIWSVGCASGEEPYSLAMLFAEALGAPEFCNRVKIYATDLDEAALQVARHATYTARDIESVPAALVEKYFEPMNNQYVFQHELRKCVIFGRHNVVQDAPISRIDLLVCRNLLIYLESETQNIVLPRLHYALVDDGYLFLGKAETQLARSKLFRPVEMRHRLFRKVPQEWRRAPGGPLSLTGNGRGESQAVQINLLEAIASAVPAAYLAVDAAGLLIFANNAARRMFDLGEADLGRPFHELPISYRPTELRSRIEEAVRQGRPVRLDNQEHLRAGSEPMRLTIELTPLVGRDAACYATLISFTDTTRTHALQQELEAAHEGLATTTEELQSANEELETTNEELQSTNEELETTNEELQSTNEELETMNEELRSTNDEIESANEELRRQSEEAAEFRSHSEAVLSSITGGVAVLDRQLTVRSWNRWNEQSWGLRSDEAVGAKFLELDIGLPLPLLRGSLNSVVDGREPRADQVLQGYDRRGRAIECMVRLTPLLLDGANAQGVVVLIEDVTEARQQEEYARYLGRIVGQSLNEIYFIDATSLRFTLVNHGAVEKLGYTAAQLKQMMLSDVMPGVTQEALRRLIAPLLRGREREIVFETVMRASSGKEHPAELCLQYFDAEQPPILVALVHDTSERVQLAREAGEDETS